MAGRLFNTPSRSTSTRCIIMCKVAWSFLGLVPSGDMSAAGSDPGLAACCPWTADVEGTV